MSSCDIVSAFLSLPSPLMFLVELFMIKFRYRHRKFIWYVYVPVTVQDNVFVTVVASVQYRCHIETAEDAFYKLTNPREQIKSYVFDGEDFSNF